MGSSTILDIVGATVIGGLMLMSVYSLNQRSTEASTQFSSDLITQLNLVSIVQTLEYDFARIGYCENADSILAVEDMIVSADSNSITFWTDFAISYENFKGDGIRDLLTYEIGPDVNETPNPNDKILYRYAGGKPKDGSNLGVTSFKIRYYSSLGTELSHPIDPTLISFMKIDMKVEDVYGYDTDNPDKTYAEKFPTVFWQQLRLATKNMSR